MGIIFGIRFTIGLIQEGEKERGRYHTTWLELGYFLSLILPDDLTFFTQALIAIFRSFSFSSLVSQIPLLSPLLYISIIDKFYFLLRIISAFDSPLAKAFSPNNYFLLQSFCSCCTRSK